MHIFEKGKIGNLELKNRVVMAPMNVGVLNNSDGCLSERGIEYFTKRAKGGVGLIVTGGVRITREFERSKETIPLWMAFADHKIHTAWINELSERCHDYGTKVAIQLTPGGGRQAGAYAQEHDLAIGPSSVPCFYPPYKNTRALTKDEIKKFIDAFQFSASIIKSAGADAIQLHGHEGYLMDQFTSSLWNNRTDEYGGSLENRLRFSREIIDAIKRGAGVDFPIIYRFGISHFTKGGRSVEEGLEKAKLLESYGVSALDVDAGCYDSWYLAHPPSTIRPGFLAPFTEKVKQVVNIPVILSGKINYPEVAESILMNKQADFISLGRPLIADAKWVIKVKEKREKDIRPCIGCHEGCLKRLMDFKSLSCAVNPAAGNEKYLTIEKADKQKKVMIVGAGIAGMVASCICAVRGHEVLLIEKTNNLGGNFQTQYLPEFKNDYKRYIAYLEQQLLKLGVQVRTKHPFNESEYKSFMPDILILANGAKFNTPQIKGIEHLETIEPLEAFEKKSFIGKITVIGGGLVGAEAALNIAQNGGKVSLIENRAAIASDAFKANKDHLMVLLNDYNVQFYVNTSVLEATNDKLYCETNGNKFILDTEKVVLCTGMTSNYIDTKFIKDFESVEIISIGDGIKPGKVIDAVWSAFRYARLI